MVVFLDVFVTRIQKTNNSKNEWKILNLKIKETLGQVDQLLIKMQNLGSWKHTKFYTNKTRKKENNPHNREAKQHFWFSLFWKMIILNKKTIGYFGVEILVYIYAHDLWEDGECLKLGIIWGCSLNHS